MLANVLKYWNELEEKQNAKHLQNLLTLEKQYESYMQELIHQKDTIRKALISLHQHRLDQIKLKSILLFLQNEDKCTANDAANHSKIDLLKEKSNILHNKNNTCVKNHDHNAPTNLNNNININPIDTKLMINWKCPLCQESFLNVESCKLHVMMHHTLKIGANNIIDKPKLKNYATCSDNNALFPNNSSTNLNLNQKIDFDSNVLTWIDCNSINSLKTNLAIINSNLSNINDNTTNISSPETSTSVSTNNTGTNVTHEIFRCKTQYKKQDPEPLYQLIGGCMNENRKEKTRPNANKQALSRAHLSINNNIKNSRIRKNNDYISETSNITTNSNICNNIDLNFIPSFAMFSNFANMQSQTQATEQDTNKTKLNPKQSHNKTKKQKNNRINTNSTPKITIIKKIVDPIFDEKRQNTIKCDKCEKYFKSKKSLFMHNNIHLKRFECKICGQCTQSRAQLISHERCHTGEKPFQCDICLRYFRTNSELKIHKRSHSGDRPYVCGLCKQAFSRSSTLTRHCKKHTGTKKHQCKICNKTFIQSYDLKKHIKIHHKQSELQLK